MQVTRQTNIFVERISNNHNWNKQRTKKIGPYLLPFTWQ